MWGQYGGPQQQAGMTQYYAGNIGPAGGGGYGGFTQNYPQPGQQQVGNDLSGAYAAGFGAGYERAMAQMAAMNYHGHQIKGSSDGTANGATANGTAAHGTGAVEQKPEPKTHYMGASAGFASLFGQSPAAPEQAPQTQYGGAMPSPQTQYNPYGAYGAQYGAVPDNQSMLASQYGQYPQYAEYGVQEDKKKKKKQKRKCC